MKILRMREKVSKFVVVAMASALVISSMFTDYGFSIHANENMDPNVPELESVTGGDYVVNVAEPVSLYNYAPPTDNFAKPDLNNPFLFSVYTNKMTRSDHVEGNVAIGVLPGSLNIYGGNVSVGSGGVSYIGDLSDGSFSCTANGTSYIVIPEINPLAGTANRLEVAVGQGYNLLKIDSNNQEVGRFCTGNLLGGFSYKNDIMNSIANVINSKAAWADELYQLPDMETETAYVLNLTAEELNAGFTQGENYEAKIIAAAEAGGKTVIVNIVSGGEVSVPQMNINSAGDKTEYASWAGRVLWNFGNASKVNTARIFGFILAPRATVVNGNNIIGGVTAGNFEQYGEVHQINWSGVIPAPPVPTDPPVPVPTESPVPVPTDPPVPAPTDPPVPVPTESPVPVPTDPPVPAPTDPPVPVPTESPVPVPTDPPVPVPTESPVPTPTNSPVPTTTPGPAGTPGPGETPGPTATPGPTETPGPGETPGPTATPGPTETPGPGETPGPTATPGPTETPGPGETPGPTATPGPTETPGPGETPGPTATPGPTETPGPGETPGPTATPGPTEPPGPGETPGPTATPGPTETPGPGETPGPTATPGPTETPGPGETPGPTATPGPTETPGPGETPDPTVTPGPTETPGPGETPDPTVTPGPSDSTPPPAVTQPPQVTPPPQETEPPVTPDDPSVPETDTIVTSVPPVTPPDPEVQGRRRARTVRIDDDEIPLSDAMVLGARRRPQTGDESDAWTMMFLASLSALIAWILKGIKR